MSRASQPELKSMSLPLYPFQPRGRLLPLGATIWMSHPGEASYVRA